MGVDDTHALPSQPAAEEEIAGGILHVYPADIKIPGEEGLECRLQLPAVITRGSVKERDDPVPPLLEGSGQKKTLDGAPPADAGVGEELDYVKGIDNSPPWKSRPSINW